MDDLRPRLERRRLRDHFTDATKIPGKVTFAGAVLGDSDLKKRHTL